MIIFLTYLFAKNFDIGFRYRLLLVQLIDVFIQVRNIIQRELE